MCARVVIGVIYLFVFIQNAMGEVPETSRQKRCIVIQKQSGARGDSAESEGDDYRRPQPKDPMPDRLRQPLDRNHDTEEIPPEPQRIRKRFDRLRQKKPNRYTNKKE